MIRRPPRSTQSRSSAASDVYKRQANESLGFDKLVSVGNKADVAEAELLEYIAHDPSTDVVALYVEGIDKGREFMRVAKEVSRMTPLVVLKAGRTDMGLSLI